MKNRPNPEQRAGYQPAAKTPEQWKIDQTPQQMEQQRQATQATVKVRYWQKIKDFFHF